MYIYPKSFLSKILKLPVILLGMIFLVSIFGFIILWSAGGGHIEPWAKKQMINFTLFLPISIIIAMIDIRTIFRFSYIFYISIVLLLIGVELFGVTAMGGKRWINIGITRLQPSEPAKLAIVLMLAKYFHQLKAEDITKMIKIILPTIGVLIPAILIVKQPDLGTGIIAVLVAVSIFFAAGVEIWKFLTVGGCILALLPIAWHMMYDYQRKRVLVFLNPAQDPLGAGYNIIQSKIAIGSGGLFGKGLTNGTQSHLDFLPEHQTDFIFSTLAEELGLFGCVCLLGIYIIIVLISLAIAVNCRSLFGKYMVIGVASILFCHVFINISMVMGVLPVVGVPLPFISYGGTMMASMLIGVGLIMNAAVHSSTNVG